MNDREKLVSAAARAGWEVRQTGKQLIFIQVGVPNRVVTVRFNGDNSASKALDGLKPVRGSIVAKVEAIFRGD